MLEEERLVDKLQKIEALFTRPGTEGERCAAGNALERIRARLRQIEQTERPVEYRFTIGDPWSRSLLIALLRRYGLAPYRHRGQRRTTIMAKVTRKFVDEMLWPEFEQLSAILTRHLEAVTQKLIAEAVHGNTADAEERAPEAPEVLSG